MSYEDFDPDDTGERELSEFEIIENDPKVRLARRGIEIEKEIRHNPVIRELLRRAFNDAVVALKSLVETDPSKVNEVRAHRDQYLRCQSIRRYIVEAMRIGQQAEAEIRDEDADT